MRLFQPFLMAVTVAAVLGIGPAEAAERPPAATPAISLSAYDEQTWAHDAHEPLLLTVVLENPQAAAVHLRNAEMARLRAEMERSDRWSRMSKRQRRQFERQHPLAAIPTVTLGSPVQPVWDVVLFAITDAAGESRLIPGRPLASTLWQDETVTLDAEQTASLLFGIEPSVLAEFPEGTYAMRALLAAPPIASPPVRVTLSRSLPLSRDQANQRDYQYGRFYLLDEQYDEAARYVERMVARDRRSLDALRLLGELWLAQGKWDEAQRTFEQAIAQYHRQRRRFWRRESPPEDLLQRLQEIQLLKAHEP